MSHFPTAATLESPFSETQLAALAGGWGHWAAAAVIALVDLGFVIGAVGLGLVTQQQPDAHFVEGGLITVVSTAQIAAAAALCAWLYQQRRGWARRGARGSAMPLVWLLAAGALITIALDEAASLHEQIDHAVHRWLGLRETPWTDRIDDAIVAAYGFAAMTALWIGRCEFKRVQAARPLLKIGLILFFLMAAMDMATNSYTVRGEAAPATLQPHPITGWLNGLEDTIKLLSEAALLGALCAIVAGTSQVRDSQPARTSRSRAWC